MTPADRTLEVVRELVDSIHHGAPRPIVTLGSHLEGDLGIYSLERSELALRLEEALGVPLGEDRVAEAAWVADLAAAVNPTIVLRWNAPETPGPPRLAAAAPKGRPGSVLFTFYVGVLLTLMVPAVWLGLLVMPGEQRATAILRRSARALLRAARCSVDVSGLEHLHGLKSSVLVANHESFIDSVVLVAALPHHLKIVVNERLPRVPLLRTAIRRPAHIVVDRATVATRLAGKTAMVAALRKGESLLVFPEGTTAPAPSLLPFRLGAFAAAVETASPIVPIAICGTRRILPRGTWLLSRGSVRVTVDPPMQPASKKWTEIVRLRDEARARIAAARSSAPAHRARSVDHV